MKKTQPNPARNPILSIRIPADRLTTLDGITQQTGITRSIIVRMALDQWLKDADKRLALFNGSR